MEEEGSTSYILENILCDTSAEPTNLPLSLFQEITENFSDKRKIGHGGFGVIYKGVLRNGMMVAVKKLSDLIMEDKSFREEVSCLMRAKHKNVVRFLGYCADTQGIMTWYNGKYVLADQRVRLLCFEYVRNSSLEKHLTNEFTGLGWHERYKVIIGICEGLRYLHEEEKITHLDLRPANILLDDSMLPKITDFGLSRLFDKEQSRIITNNCHGSFGYMAPEYLGNGIISFKADIYSLGMTILEIITGTREQHRIEDAYDNWMKRLHEESSLSLDVYCQQVKICIEIASNCVVFDINKRPDIGDIVCQLNDIETTIHRESLCCNEPGTSTEQDKESIPVSKRNIIFSPSLESPKLQSPSERNEKEDSLLPSNPKEVETLRRDSARNPLVAFTSEELKRITKNFRPDSLLGEGGFGRVFKGYITNDIREGLAIEEPLRVSVKFHVGDNSYQGREWLAEVIFLGQLSHPNLVKLVGYCCEDDRRVLVYEFMPRGHVESHLFSMMLTLPWSTRMKIALGAAKGLAFLHEAEKPVIYRDFNTSNILLDEEYNAKLYDFGLAKDGPAGNKSHVSTRIMGTYGYAAPEYIMTGHLTAMSDVYSYGVVLLELLTGRKSLDRSRPVREQTLVDWAIPLLTQEKKVLGIVDPRLAEDCPVKAVQKTAMLAYHCLNRNPKARPLMRDIVATLEPLQQLANPSDTLGGGTGT